MKYFLCFFFMFQGIISIENIKNIAVIKFKTYYPMISNILNDNYNFVERDYVKSIVLSKIYLELEIFDEKNNKTGTKQVLNTFFDSNANTFSFISPNNIYNSEETNFLCNYNISLSDSLEVNTDKNILEENFKIYSDFSMSKYNYIPLKCYKRDLNDSICGKIGVDLLLQFNSDKTNFVPQILKHLNTSDKSYAFKYLNNSNNDEGIFILGDIYNYLNNSEYNESDLISFYSQTTTWEISMDSIILEGYNISSNDIYDYIYVSISPEYEGLVFSEYYINILNNIFFDKYFKDNICRIESVGSNPTYTIVSCDGNKFGKNDILKFPKIIFTRFKFDFNITFDGEELFYYKNNRYFFRVYKITGK